MDFDLNYNQKFGDDVLDMMPTIIEVEEVKYENQRR